jgi:hypothetical protein
MRIRRYSIYWTLAILALTFGTFILAFQLVGQRELPSVNSPSSYVGYISLVWHGSDRLRDGDTTWAIYAADAFCLALPYLLISIGVWFCIVGYKRRECDRVPAYGPSVELNSSSPDPHTENIWPPAIKSD